MLCDFNFSLLSTQGCPSPPGSTDRERILLTMQDVTVRLVSRHISGKGLGLTTVFDSPNPEAWIHHQKTEQ